MGAAFIVHQPTVVKKNDLFYFHHLFEEDVKKFPMVLQINVYEDWYS